MVSASWLLRKYSNRSACEPRAPRWTSEINKVRKRRSGLSSLKESLPIPAHLTDFCDRAMTVHAAITPRESMPRPLCLRIAARCDKQATRDDLRSPDGAQRNPGPVTQAGSVAPDFASLHPGYKTSAGTTASQPSENDGSGR